MAVIIMNSGSLRLASAALAIRNRQSLTGWQQRAEAQKAFGQFISHSQYHAKYPKAMEKLEKDRDSLLAFHDFPAEHWQHLRTTNPIVIASMFATVRHRTTRTRNCVSRATFLAWDSN